MENVNLDFWTLIQQGAISTYPLLLCSVLVLGVAIERAVALRGALSSAGRLTGEVVPLVWRQGFTDAQTQVERSGPSPMKRIFAEVLKSRQELPTPQLERLASDRQFEEIQGAGSYLWILGTIGAAAPFIGLFGTVWGIILAFQNIGLQGSTSLSVVAPGIADALVATAAGLFAAVPAVYFYNEFTTRVKDFATKMDDFALEFLNICERNFT